MSVGAAAGPGAASSATIINKLDCDLILAFTSDVLNAYRRRVNEVVVPLHT